MLNIIKSDIYRLFKGKCVFIVTLIIMILAGVSVATMSAGHFGIAVGSAGQMEQMSNPEFVQKMNDAKTLKDFREVMHELGSDKLDRDIIAQNINLYYFLIAFVVVIITRDFSNKSVKNTLSSAVSRREYYTSKLLLLLGVTTVLVLFNNYFNYFLNLIVNKKEMASSIGYITKITLYQMPLIYGMAMMLVCIAFAVRKTSIFNTISIPFIMVIQVIMMIVFAIIRETPEWYTKFEVQNALANLANDPSSKYIVECGLLGIIYIVIFGCVGYYIFSKAEIK
ncbi:MAG: hypothetical protein E7254_00605 [Lachnospiraceae bacterium]|nr:hypothetical protein [Lachnospiraceae bacterium]